MRRVATTPAPAGFVDPRDPLPFEDLLAPIVEQARGALRDAQGAGRLAPAAEARLGRDLLELLASASLPTLAAGFQKTRGPGRFARYRARSLDRGLAPERPALAALVEELSARWVAATAEFLARLDADGEALGTVFGGGRTLGRVTLYTPGLSDRHRGGRTVAEVRFESGLRVLYKPRDLSPEAAFFDVAAWVDREAGEATPPAPAVLVRDGYGWMEHVARRGCEDDREVELHYRRAGRLLGLLHVLGATDCHAGNVVAAGPSLVPVDLETLFQPPGLPERGLLGVGLLPSWKRGLDGRLYDVGALTGSTGDAAFRPWRGRRLNTDGMELRPAYDAVRGVANRASRDGAPVAAWDHADELVLGYRESWERLARRRRALEGMLAGWRDLPVRRIARPTLTYAGLLRRSLEPGALRSPEARAERVARLLHDAGPAAPIDGLGQGEVARRELEALLGFDVPVFRTPAGPGVRAAVERLRTLDAGRLAEAEGSIRATLALARLQARAVTRRGTSGAASRPGRRATGRAAS